jgi:hypothetical protein
MQPAKINGGNNSYIHGKKDIRDMFSTYTKDSLYGRFTSDILPPCNAHV